jgi:hypothetical protein
MQNVHSVVYSVDPSTSVIANLNRDVLCLDGFLSYTIPEYLEDRTSNGVSLLSVEGNLHRFSDGAAQILIQQIERFNPALLAGCAHA